MMVTPEMEILQSLPDKKGQDRDLLKAHKSLYNRLDGILGSHS